MIRPVGYGVIGALGTSASLSDEPASRPTQTVPCGTGSLLTPFQAINCLATFIESLRDKNTPTRLHISESTTLRAQAFEDEDDDEYEYEAQRCHAESRGLSASSDETKKSRKQGPGAASFRDKDPSALHRGHEAWLKGLKQVSENPS